jgi:hypothetical protein
LEGVCWRRAVGGGEVIVLAFLGRHGDT